MSRFHLPRNQMFWYVVGEPPCITIDKSLEADGMKRYMELTAAIESIKSRGEDVTVVATAREMARQARNIHEEQ